MPSASDPGWGWTVLSRTSGVDWLGGALAALGKLRVAVWGDFCLDAYWDLDEGEAEFSIETGLPVRRVRGQRYSLGGAGNVAANLRALGVGDVEAIGVVGPDFFGGELQRLLRECGAGCGWVVTDPCWQTMVYAKLYGPGGEENRIDFGAFNDLSAGAASALIAALDRAAAESGAVVLNQQVPRGVSGREMIERINLTIARHPETVFLADARQGSEHYRGAAIKLNMQEAARYLGAARAEPRSSETAGEFARRISLATGKPVFLTRSEYGITAADGENIFEIPGIEVAGPIDPVGAGDTVTAALAAMLGSGQDPRTAAQVANIAAAVTVRKLRTTGTAAPPEILAAGAEPAYVYEPDLAASPRRARYLPGSSIEIVRPIPEDLELRHCFFDHDGTLSTLREGWEKIMEQTMVRAVLAARYNDAEAAAISSVSEEVRRFIDRTTGMQTLAQMQGLADLVRRSGYAREEEILDAHGYKRMFNRELMDVVQSRMRKLRSGELEAADFQIKNAVRLLEELRRRGVKLSLVSGTDQADVITEAEALGYAELFEGRIFGALGDIGVEAKKAVLDRTIAENDLQGRQFACFGDGPMEIRETRRRGGLCVGVASDEPRRFGWNMAKRSRLIRAGADLLVSDYCELPALLKALHLA